MEKVVRDASEGEPSEVRIPPPYALGEERHESLGHFVDRLMGHERDAREADAALANLLIREEDVPEDPEPVEIPDPIPDADEPVKRGRHPDSRNGQTS
jgi:hypothetical protein